MKFSAKLVKAKVLLKIILNIQKIPGDCVVHITQKKVAFIIRSDLDEGGSQVWCEIENSNFFDELNIQSLSDNEIQFQLEIEHLKRVLQSATTSMNEITVKLAKRGIPYLKFIIQSTQQSVILIQEIPIVLLTQQQMAQINEPQLPDPDVNIFLPNLKTLQNIIDKMKNISDELCITISNNSELKLAVETNAGSISTFYQGLTHATLGGKDKTQSQITRSSAVVDIKKFQKVLVLHSLSPDDVVCCIYESSLLIHAMLHNHKVVVTYYLPIIIKN
ncbi:hypothetical protein CYY_000899 [Polysphondylium violaceum]|uniref:Checkpoint protein n=1 Tax=Polysphondylium violaceum TaxID=133409 RepID=A0A8J4PYY9_9MYCE|nr:hypothetical protein CYY_000899 [Polysphondylium violaceum]